MAQKQGEDELEFWEKANCAGDQIDGETLKTDQLKALVIVSGLSNRELQHKLLMDLQSNENATHLDLKESWRLIKRQNSLIKW